MANVKLTKQEQLLIKNSLQCYNEISKKALEDDGVYISPTKKRPLGHVERSLLKERKEKLKPLITKFENL